MKRGYVRFLQETFDAWGVDRIVHIGDLADWNSISYHEKHPGNSNAKQERIEAKKRFKRSQYNAIGWAWLLWWVLPKVIEWFLVWWFSREERV